MHRNRFLAADVAAFSITYVVVFIVLGFALLLIVGQLVASGITAPRATRALGNPFTDMLRMLVTKPHYWLAHALLCIPATAALIAWDRRRRTHL